MRVYPGNYEDYLWRVNGGGLMPPGVVEMHNNEFVTETAAAEAALAMAKAAEPAKKVNPLRLAKMREELSGVEDEMSRLEAEIAAGEQQLAVYVSADETQRTAQKLHTNRAEAERLMARWEELTAELETMGG